MIAAPDLDRKALGRYMRRVRNELGLSLVTQEQRTGLHQVVVGSYERGDRNPSLSQLLAWTSGLDQRLAVLGPDEVVLAPRRGGGTEYVTHVVCTPTGLEIERPTQGAAEALAAEIYGSKVGYRIHRVGPVEFAAPVPPHVVLNPSPMSVVVSQ